MTSHDQYLAVTADLKERYPHPEWISLQRRSFNIVSADVEAPDLHHTVTYFFKGSAIDDSWVNVWKKQCTENCLHSQYPQEDPHKLLPEHLSATEARTSSSSSTPKRAREKGTQRH